MELPFLWVVLVATFISVLMESITLPLVASVVCWHAVEFDEPDPQLMNAVSLNFCCYKV